METSSEITPLEQMPLNNNWAMRLPESDSSTCLAWHAYDKDNNRHLFIKQLRPDLASSQKHRNAFIKEYNVAQKLNSEYFPAYHNLEDSERGLFITMDFIDGETLNQKMHSAPTYFRNKSNLLRLIRQLLMAMEAMHQADITHLDLKPENIMLTRRTNNVKIIDFGYSCTGEWNMTQGMTRAFAAPEQLMQNDKKIGVATDIYAFGRIIQEITWQTNCHLPRAIRHIVDRCVNKQPEERYSSAKEIITEIDSSISLKKKQMTIVSAISMTLTSIAFIMGLIGYNYYSRDTFEIDGLRYHILKGMWVMVGHEDVVELIGKTEDKVLDSCFVIPNTVTFRDQEYKVFKVSEYAFTHNDEIKKIVFPEELRFAWYSAFRYCNNLEEVEIQQNVSYIEHGAFSDCPSLKSIKISKKNPYLYVEDGVMYRNDPFNVMMCMPSKKGKYIVPQGIKEICNDAFVGCKELTDIVIPEGVEKIRPNAFEGCSSLTSITIPSSVVDIENSLFRGCTSLQHVTLSNKTVILGLETFIDCRSLKEITIPASVIRIGMNCFQGTDSLENVINLAANPQDINENVFSRYGNLYVPDNSVKAYKEAPNWSRFKVHPLSEYKGAKFYYAGK